MHRLLLGARGLRIAAANPATVRVVAVSVSAAALGTVAYVRSYPQQDHGIKKQKKNKGFLIPRPLMEAICGAAGEVAQICVLYPLETIKVRCQSECVSAGIIIRDLFSRPGALRVLYSGFGSAALCSMVVGSIHYVSFCMSKRLALSTAAALSGSDPKASELGSSSNPGAAVAATANLFAAVMGALATALVESPVELFRHQAQAGLVSGNFMKEMMVTLRTQGPMGLYWGFLPYCFESFPYDITELGTYSSLRDAYELTSKGDGELSQKVNRVPSHVWDIGIGACAGAAAVLVSMPFDCIKTYMQTHGREMAAKGAWGQTTAFVATGAKLVNQQGIGGLFVGTVPRLVQQVPSSTICWWAIERCRHVLEPYTAP